MSSGTAASDLMLEMLESPLLRKEPITVYVTEKANVNE